MMLSSIIPFPLIFGILRHNARISCGMHGLGNTIATYQGRNKQQGASLTPIHRSNEFSEAPLRSYNAILDP